MSSSSSSKKSKPTLWQSLTHSPSQSYLSSAPVRPRRVSTASKSTNPTPSISSFNSDSNVQPTTQTAWVHPSLRRSMAAAAGGGGDRFEVVARAEEGDGEEERRRRKKSSRRRREAEEQQQEQQKEQQQQHHHHQPSFDLVQLQSEREREGRRGGRNDLASSSSSHAHNNRGEGSSTGGTVRERERTNSSSSRPSPSSPSSPSSPLEPPPSRPPSSPNNNHSRSNSFSSSNSGSRISRFGLPSLGTVVEDTTTQSLPASISAPEQQREQPAYFFNSSSVRGGWNTSLSAPPQPPSPIPLPPQPPAKQHRRPVLSPSSTLAFSSNSNAPRTTTSNSSSMYSSPEQQQNYVASSSSNSSVGPSTSQSQPQAVTLETLTPPDSEVGLGIRVNSSREQGGGGGDQGHGLDASTVAQKLNESSSLGTRRRKSVAVEQDGSASSEEDDVFWTPRTSMYSVKSFATGVDEEEEEDEEEVEGEGEERGRREGRESPPQTSTPTLTLQPPTPLGFPATHGYGHGGEEHRGRDLFGEVSFHPERVEEVIGNGNGKERERERTRSTSSTRPSSSSRRDRGSPSFLPSPLSYTHLEDAYSGLAYDDPEPQPDLQPLPPPRFPSSSTSSSSPSSTGSSSSSSKPIQPTTPTTIVPQNNILLSSNASYPKQLLLQQPPPSSRNFVPPHLRPFPKRPGSVVSNVSTSSKYSQASYRSEVDAPPPIIIPRPSNSNSTSSSTSARGRPNSMFSPSNNNNNNNNNYIVTSPGSILSNSNSLTAPSSPSRYHQTPFLPRPTSVLIDSFEGSTLYPSLGSSAPSSVLPGSEVGGNGRGSGARSRRASEGGEERNGRGSSKRLGSEAGGMSTVSTYRMPQVLGGAASLGEGGGSSLSGGSGYSTLTLPSGSYRPTTTHTTSRLSSLLSPSRPLSVVGLPTTSLSTLSLLSSPPPFSSSSSSSSQTHPHLSVSYTSHTPPPTKLPSSSVLVRVWAIALDSHDARAARRGEKGAIVGRSWVGKVVECGENVGGGGGVGGSGSGGGKGFAKGEWVYGLVPGGGAGAGAGAAKEFLVVERRWLAGCSAPCGMGMLVGEGEEGGDGEEWMSLEDLASIPLLGVTAHRAVGSVPRGSRALVLLGGAGGGEGGGGGGSDWGVGILAAQEMLSKGVVVVIQVVEEWGEEWVREAVTGDEGSGGRRRGLEVKVGEAVEVVNGEHEGSFEFVLDCEGGRRVYDASRRVLGSGGLFTSTKGDSPSPSSPSTTTTTTSSSHLPTSSSPSSSTTKNSFRSLRRTFIKKDRKQISYLVLPPSGTGPSVDALGEDVRDILEWITATKPYRPVRVGKVVPLERGGEAFEVVGGGGKGGKRYACEEEVWGVRLVN